MMSSVFEKQHWFLNKYSYFFSKTKKPKFRKKHTGSTIPLIVEPLERFVLLSAEVFSPGGTGTIGTLDTINLDDNDDRVIIDLDPTTPIDVVKDIYNSDIISVSSDLSLNGILEINPPTADLTAGQIFKPIRANHLEGVFDSISGLDSSTPGIDLAYIQGPTNVAIVATDLPVSDTTFVVDQQDQFDSLVSFFAGGSSNINGLTVSVIGNVNIADMYGLEGDLQLEITEEGFSLSADANLQAEVFGSMQAVGNLVINNERLAGSLQLTNEAGSSLFKGQVFTFDGYEALEFNLFHGDDPANGSYPIERYFDPDTNQVIPPDQTPQTVMLEPGIKQIYLGGQMVLGDTLKLNGSFIASSYGDGYGVKADAVVQLGPLGSLQVMGEAVLNNERFAGALQYVPEAGSNLFDGQVFDVDGYAALEFNFYYGDNPSLGPYPIDRYFDPDTNQAIPPDQTPNNMMLDSSTLQMFTGGHALIANTLELDGNFILSVGSNGFNVATDAMFQLDPLGSVQVAGNLVLNSERFAGSLQLTEEASSNLFDGQVFDVDGYAALEFNFYYGSDPTAGGYMIQQYFDPGTGQVIPPDQQPQMVMIEGSTIQLFVGGQMLIGDGALTLEGSYTIAIGAIDYSTVGIEIQVDATAQLEVLGSVKVTGDLELNNDRFAGALQIAAQAGTPTLDIPIFTFDGYGALEFNIYYGSDPFAGDYLVERYFDPVTGQVIPADETPQTILIDPGTFQLFLGGELVIADTLTLDGSFELVVDQTGFQMHSDAKLILDPLGAPHAEGTLEITNEHFVGALQLTGDISLGIVKFTGYAALELNYYYGNDPYGLYYPIDRYYDPNTGQVVPADGTPYTYMLAPNTLQVYVGGQMNVSNLISLNGSFELVANRDGFTVDVDAKINAFFGIEVYVSGDAGIYFNNPGLLVDIRVGVLNFGITSSFAVTTTNARLYIDTRAGQAQAYIDLGLFNVNFVNALTGFGTGYVGANNNNWEFNNSIYIDFFGLKTTLAETMFNGSGEFYIHVDDYMKLGGGNTYVDAHMIATISFLQENDDRNEHNILNQYDLIVYGSIGGSAKFLGWPVASVSADLDYNSSTGQISTIVETKVNIIVDVITVRIGFHIGYLKTPPSVFLAGNLNDPTAAVWDPQKGAFLIPEWQGGDLYLNVGDRSPLRNILTDQSDESYYIEALGPGTDYGQMIMVMGMGISQTFDNVTRINADAGDGYDHIEFADSVAVSVTVYGGADEDRLEYYGSSYADLYGQDGDDLIFNGDGPSMLSGGSGIDEIHTGAGNDTVDSGSGDDKIYCDMFNLSSDTVIGGSGNDLLYVSLTDEEDDIDVFKPAGSQMQIDRKGNNQITETVTVQNGIEECIIDAAGNTDTINIDAFSSSTDDVADIAIEMMGGGGFDSLNVSGTTDDDLFVISNQQLYINGLQITYDTIESVNMFGNVGNDQLYVLSTSGQTATHWFGDTGSDHIYIGANIPDGGPVAAAFPVQPQTLDGILGPVFIDDTPELDGDVDILDVVDIDASTDDYGVHSEQTWNDRGVHTLSGLGMGGDLTLETAPGEFETYPAGISYTNLEIFELQLGTGNETLDIESIADNTTTIIHGNAGSDTFNITAEQAEGGLLAIYGDTSANETQDVDPGNDVINAYDATMQGTYYGGPGNDTIYGGSNNDLIIGGSGNDIISAGFGSDIIFGDTGMFHFNSDSNVIDSIEITNPFIGGDDTIYAGDGNDLVIGAGGVDTIAGDSGNDLIFGDFGRVEGLIDLSLLPFDQADHPFTFSSDYTTDIYSGQSDIIDGGDGDDILIGGQGNDIIYGGRGDDDIIGGHNTPDGNDGSDTIDSGFGNDIIIGDNGSLLRYGDLANPRNRVLAGQTFYGEDPLTNDALPLITSQPQPDVKGITQRTIILYNHTVNTSTDYFGNDYIAGGPDDDLIFGQLGDDTIQGDGSIESAMNSSPNPVTAERDENGILHVVPSFETDTDGDDYIEGNGGNDIIFGNLGQDDIIGDNSSLYSLENTLDRSPVGSDLIFGGAGTQIDQDNIGDNSDVGHAADADAIVGDNGNIYRLVGIHGQYMGQYLSFNYDNYSDELKIIPRAVDMLDYTPGGMDYNPAQAANDLGAPDEIHGESGDDIIYGQKGDDVLFGDAQDDDIIGGYGNDWISGGTGIDGILGDDGRIYTARNIQKDNPSDSSLAEPLYNIAKLDAVDQVIKTPGKNGLEATINPEDELKKIVNLTPFNLDPDTINQDPLFEPQFANDVIYGDSGDDFLHGGAGDDTISGNDGNDAIFGDLGNDYLIGGTGNDHLYGGYGNDILNADDNFGTNFELNNMQDDDPINADIAFGGAGMDTLIGNSRSDCLIDWPGQFNTYIVPFAASGMPTISRSMQPQIQQFLFDLSEADGTDLTRILDMGSNPSHNGEPDGELGLINQKDMDWHDQTGSAVNHKSVKSSSNLKKDR